MKKLKLFLPAALVMGGVIIFTSCDPSDGPVEPSYSLEIVGFEDAELPAVGYDYTDHAGYAEKGIEFAYTYTEDSYEWEGVVYPLVSWAGFMVSDNIDMVTPGYINEFSVYSSGGARRSSQFAVSFGVSEFVFVDGKNHEIEYAWFINSTYAALSMQMGDMFAKKFAADDWFKLTVTGFDAAGKQTATADIYLADFRDGKKFVMSDWTKFPLIGLGKVNKVSFALTSSDTGQNGMNTPNYFCIDNIAYRVY